MRCLGAEREDKMTKAPPRYTEATLLSAMETAGKLDRRRGAARGDEGVRPRHAGDARGDHRDAHPPRVHRARRQGPPADAEGPAGDHDARGAQDHLAGADRRLGEEALRHRAREAATAARSSRRSRASPTRSSSRSRRSTRRSSGPERVELGPCPRCGAETGEIIRENSRAYGCTSWKSREETGCGFVIWKRVAGRTLTPEIARQLIEEGKTREVLSGFRSRAGKPFRARLVLNDGGEGRVRLPRSARRQPRKPAAAE